MNLKHTVLLSFAGLLILPLSALALDQPTAEKVPSEIDADFYTLTIKTAPGAKVTVTGGPTFVPPETDGAGKDILDGKVRVMVALIQNADNVFSVVAEKDGQFSPTLLVTIKESAQAKGASNGPEGDTVPPKAPLLEKIENPVTSAEYTLVGSTEADANIYVDRADGARAGSARANSNGVFRVTVTLEIGKTNRFNVYAEDAAYNQGPATQAVIQALRPSDSAGKTMESGAVSPFTDIKGHWAENYIVQIYQKGIVKGKTENQFDPNAPITRAELTKIALRAFGHEIPAAVQEKPFKDVPLDAWFAPYLAVAKEKGIVAGFADGFHPNDPITRAAALKILLEASGLEISGGKNTFPDVPKGAWFEKYVAFAVENGIVSGYKDGSFKPENPITRAETAKIAVGIIGLIQ